MVYCFRVQYGVPVEVERRQGSRATGQVLCPLRHRPSTSQPPPPPHLKVSTISPRGPAPGGHQVGTVSQPRRGVFSGRPLPVHRPNPRSAPGYVASAGGCVIPPERGGAEPQRSPAPLPSILRIWVRAIVKPNEYGDVHAIFSTVSALAASTSTMRQPARVRSTGASSVGVTASITALSSPWRIVAHMDGAPPNSTVSRGTRVAGRHRRAHGGALLRRLLGRARRRRALPVSAGGTVKTAASGQILHGGDQVSKVAAEAVELPDNEHVALAQGAQAAVEPRPVVAYAGSARSW